MFKYRLFWADGSEAGEAAYAVNIRPGDEIHVGTGRRLTVVDVVPANEEEDSPYVGFLMVEPC